MLEIYGYLKDPFAWGVRFAAEEKGVPYQWIPSDVSFPDPRAARNNPMTRSPLVRHEDFTLGEAFNILAYVDEAFPGRRLQPESPRGRAVVRMFQASLEALAELVRGGPGAAPMNRRATKRMEDLLKSIDQQLGQGGQPWLDGDRPGLRDISFLPLLSDLEAAELSFPPSLEVLSAYWQRAMTYAPFQTTNYRTAAIAGQR